MNLKLQPENRIYLNPYCEFYLTESFPVACCRSNIVYLNNTSISLLKEVSKSEDISYSHLVDICRDRSPGINFENIIIHLIEKSVLLTEKRKYRWRFNDFGDSLIKDEDHPEIREVLRSGALNRYNM